MSLGGAFLLSATFVRLRDINYIWEILMQGLFYASVVIYPIQMIISTGGKFAKLLLLNPVAQVIQDSRNAIIGVDGPSLFSLSGGNILITAIPFVIVIGVCVVGAYYFRKQSPSFAENV